MLIKQKVTLYFRSPILGNIIKVEATSYSTEIGAFAQYPGAVKFSWIPKRARIERGDVQTTFPSLLILDGWGHLDPQGAWEKCEAPTGGADVVMQKSRYRSCSDRWSVDFDAQISEYLARTGAKVLHDFRRHDPHARPAAVALR